MLALSSYTYNGSVKSPSVVVEDSQGNALKKDTDYTVTYSNNIDAGTAKVIIKGKGNYSFTYTYRFPITKLDLPTRDGYTFKGWVDASIENPTEYSELICELM